MTWRGSGFVMLLGAPLVHVAATTGTGSVTTPWWYTAFIPVVGVVVGVIGGFLASSINTVRAFKQQQEQANVAYERQLELNRLTHQQQLERDARERAHATLVVEREALRVAYINVDVAAQALMDVEHSQRFLLKGQTEEARNKQLNAYLTDATKEHARTMAALRLASKSVSTN